MDEVNSRGGANFYKTEDFGESWDKIELPVKKFWSFATPKQNPNTVYLGVEPANVFKSTDRGKTFKKLEAVEKLPGYAAWTFPEAPGRKEEAAAGLQIVHQQPHFKSVSMDPSDPNTLYGAIEEGWTVCTRDGGETFEELYDGMYFDAHIVKVHEQEPDIVYCTTGRGFYRSEEKGRNWKRVGETTGDNVYTNAILLHPENSDNILMTAAINSPPSWARGEGPDSRMFISENRGETFVVHGGELSKFQNELFYALGRSKINPDTLYIGGTGGSLLMEDGGFRWNLVQSDLPPIMYIDTATA